jgi:hypothetical protein
MQHEEFEPELPGELTGSAVQGPVPRPLLEQNVVDRLVQSGFLNRDTRGRVGGVRLLTWRSLTLAASLLLAFQLGRMVGSSGARGVNPSGAASLPDPRDGVELAQWINSSASQYVRAISLTRSGDSVARAAAFATLREVVDSMANIAPDHSTAIALQLAFPDPTQTVPVNATALASPSRIIWY